MKRLILLLLFIPLPALALQVYDQNVFDQLQGDWKPEFRGQRLAAVSDYIHAQKPDIVVFEEARGLKPGAEGGGEDSVDAQGIAKLYPFRKYVHEMTGDDKASYGYWIGAKKKPREWFSDGFSFPGGVARKTIAAVWDRALGNDCVGVLGLHLSYQNSEVRQKEAVWLLDWLKAHEKSCAHWVVVGDFNADAPDKEMQALFAGGLKPLFQKKEPTAGPYNPIRAIYGKEKPSLTIDWALGWNLGGAANVVLNEPYKGVWVSDHAGVWVKPSLKKGLDPVAKGAFSLLKLQDTYRNAASLEADFTQEVYQASLGRTKSSKGGLKLSKPNFLRWEIFEPEASVTVSNGHKVSYYTPDARGKGKGQVMERRATDLERQPLFRILTGASALDKEFTILSEEKAAGPKEGNPLTTISLKPQKQMADLAKVSLVVDSKYLIQEVITETASGNRTKITLQNQTLGDRLPPALFEFKPPADTEVLQN